MTDQALVVRLALALDDMIDLAECAPGCVHTDCVICPENKHKIAVAKLALADYRSQDR